MRLKKFEAIELSSERLNYRSILKKDEQALFRLITQPRVLPHLGLHPSLYAFPSRLYRYFEEAQDTQSGLHLVIRLEQHTEIIGLVSLQKLDAIQHSAVLGYCIDPRYWNQGLATEAAGRILSYGIQELGMRQIKGRCKEDNVASQRVMLACGMTRLNHMKDPQAHFTPIDSGFFTYILNFAR
ncbi:ribosomal-protein-alanine N-acetyltransferase [Paenibacillus shirakamiensis]|uniref:Ribosomal-protein-alanine N-acetyltransferase n=1 Tax=Paenibacillus shirakamiensis TaxID=1265935 RepID=A0ABS4JM89_9BACL|nr:GNAT family N-acetyltransferase [Paenibacillus shirakamiensis]MBP2002106.1 ribosomal-protein-alanine N-acetyltransferase [Paenibacillus shirakamiensis]